MVEALHHLHKRKRAHQKKERYPHPNNLKRFFDIAVYGAGIFGPIITLPQVYKIWYYKNATGVSALSWGGYIAPALIWFIYGILHKEKPIILTYSLWVVLEVVILIGILLYG